MDISIPSNPVVYNHFWSSNYFLIISKIKCQAVDSNLVWNIAWTGVRVRARSQRFQFIFCAVPGASLLQYLCEVLKCLRRVWELHSRAGFFHVTSDYQKSSDDSKCWVLAAVLLFKDDEKVFERIPRMLTRQEEKESLCSHTERWL
jgi:hypothetical protein